MPNPLSAFQQPVAFQDQAFQFPDWSHAFQDPAFQLPVQVGAFQDTAFQDDVFQETPDAFQDGLAQGDAYQIDVLPPPVLPPRPIFVAPFDERRRQQITPAPVVLVGAQADVVWPPAAVVSTAADRPRTPVVPATVSHGFDTGAPAVTPPAPTVVPVEDRSRRPSGGGMISVGYPSTDLPPPPVSVPAEDRHPLFDRLRQPTATHGFVDPGPAAVGTTPPPVNVVPLIDERERQRPQLLPVVISGAQYVTVVPTVTPPPPVNVDRADQRARYRPLDPTVLSGAADFQTGALLQPPVSYVVPLDDKRARLSPAPQPQLLVGFDDVAPPQPTVVALEDRRRRGQTPDPVIVSGALAGLVPPVQGAPPPPVVVNRDERSRFFVIPPPTGTHGFVDPGPGPVGTTPPPPTNVDRSDQRGRYRPPDPTIISGALYGVTPVVVPPGPYVVPVDERRRFLAALPPEITVGFDDADPPLPNVVGPEDRRGRYAPPDPTSISGARLGATPTLPPGPFVVPLEERRRLLALIPPAVGIHGFDAGPPPGTVPSGFGSVSLADLAAFGLALSDIAAEDEQLADQNAEMVLVADGETWLTALSDSLVFAVNLADTPGG